MTSKKWLFGVGVVLFVALCAAGVFAVTKYSRSIDIGEAPHAHVKPSADAPTQNATTTVATNNSTPAADPAADPVVAAPSTFPFPTAPINPVAYNAKMLAIANVPPARTITIKVGSTTVTKTVPPTPTGWPVTTSARAPYPITGALLPFDRIVAYYGNLYSAQMGVLGQYPQAQVLAMLASTTAMWQAADPSTPVVPALDYIAVTAQGSAGADGKYRDRMPASQINEILNMANEAHGIVFLDIQVGLSNVETEVPLLEPYLKLPQVELSLDPEFDMHDGEKPGTIIGTMDASDINWAANYLANLVTQYNLPPKILVVHRFTDNMVTHTSEIAPLPQVQIVMDMDGFGFPAKKINTYQQVIIPYPVQFTGFKLFYHNDTLGPLGALMIPAQVLKLSPQPSYIQYQ